jgi:predicted SAM-dependent methyltransferase
MRAPIVKRTPRVVTTLKRLANVLGFEVTRFRQHTIDKNQINLNIGSSGYDIPGFVNLDKPSDWYSSPQSRSKFLSFDITSDRLPYEDEAISNIYISHVIEHLRDSDVERLIEDCLRVIHPGGVIRIAVPDAYFLWRVSLFENQFWDRNELNKDFKEKAQNEPANSLDHFINEIGSIKRSKSDISEKEFQLLKEMSFLECVEFIQARAKYDPLLPGNHVTWWTMEKISKMISEKMTTKVQIIQSKYQASVSPAMVGSHFDKTSTRITLYVELIKTSSLKE